MNLEPRQYLGMILLGPSAALHNPYIVTMGHSQGKTSQGVQKSEGESKTAIHSNIN